MAQSFCQLPPYEYLFREGNVNKSAYRFLLIEKEETNKGRHETGTAPSNIYNNSEKRCSQT
jgi:hypothetical protein